MRAYFQYTARLLLIGIQLAVAAFYAFYAVMMWGPFMAGPAWAKLSVFALIFWPVVAFVLAAKKASVLSMSATLVIAILTLAQLVIVMVLAIMAS